MAIKTNTYDHFADQYTQIIENPGERFSPYHVLVVPHLLERVGNVAGLSVLDAGCGEGYVARILAERGAKVTAADVAPRLIERAKAQTPASAGIAYLAHDLSQLLPAQYNQGFELVISNLVLNDVYDYVGFINTLGAAIKPGGRLVLTLNNPYSAVIRDKVKNYFESDTAILYHGLATAGVEVYYIHRTLEEFMTAFLAAGFALKYLSDVPITQQMLQRDGAALQKYYHFPYFMLLEFMKTTRDV